VRTLSECSDTPQEVGLPSPAKSMSLSLPYFWNNAMSHDRPTKTIFLQPISSSRIHKATMCRIELAGSIVMIANRCEELAWLINALVFN
jgi:hypothetical protein